MGPPLKRRILPDLPVQEVRRIASDKGISPIGVVGNERLVEFHADGVMKTLLMKVDMETFSPNDVLRLIAFFPSRLTKEDFWPATQ